MLQLPNAPLPALLPSGDRPDPLPPSRDGRGVDGHPPIAPAIVPRAILRLTLTDQTLWAEEIDTDLSGHRRWVRPVVLAIAAPDEAAGDQYFDVRDRPDLVLPKTWFHPAFDTDALAALSTLASEPVLAIHGQRAHGAFQQFLQRLWQAPPNAAAPPT